MNEDPRDRKTQSQLIPLLQKAQHRDGYLSKAAMQSIARQLALPVAKVYGVATFYNQFKLQPPGRVQIQICRGTACHVRGSQSVLDSLERELGIGAGQTTTDGLFSLEVVACIGACGLAPVISVNGEFHAAMTPQKTAQLIARIKRELNDAKAA
jgi:NADH-quinone oxidoreductase subunit E